MLRHWQLANLPLIGALKKPSAVMILFSPSKESRHFEIERHSSNPRLP